MTKIILIRHGYSKGNKEKRFSGQLDVPLDEVGSRQAASIARHILNNYSVDAVYSSDLCRAYDTVKPIADALHLDVRKCKELREVDVGDWQGMLIEEVKTKFPNNFELYRKKPGLVQFDHGESYAMTLERARAAVRKIAEENEGKTVVIGTHGGVIRVLRAKWIGVPLEKIEEIPHVPNGSITVVEFKNGIANLKEVGYCEHLLDRITEESIK